MVDITTQGCYGSSTTYSSVLEAVWNVTEDKFAKKIEARLRSRQIVKTLVVMRIAKGISQAEIAKVLECTQSHVLKIESGVDKNLTPHEVAAYLKLFNQYDKLYSIGD